MTGDELKDIRHDLGEAIGKRLSWSDMARICGLADPDRNGKDTMRKWGDGAGPSGPVAVLVSIIAAAYADDCDPAVSEFFDEWIERRLS